MVVTGEAFSGRFAGCQESGLVHAPKTLSSVKGLHFHQFDYDGGFGIL